jgi:hypothetical protein
MRCVTALLALSALLLSRPGLAEDEAASRLVGSWRLVSFQVRFVGEDAAPRDIFGPHPFGRIILTPGHHMMAYLSRPDRKPPANDAEAAALLRSMNAYTGRFRVEGDRFVTTVDGAWTEVFKASEQVRYFTLDGDRLTIRTPEQPSGTMPGKRAVATLVWEREE